MTDRLTQLQDALDQLATQIYSTLRYLNEHHPIPIAGPSSSSSSSSTHNNPPPPPPPHSHTPLPAAAFAAAQRELARDLIVKEQQIEYLIAALPGIGRSEREQEEGLVRLERELEVAEGERRRAVAERERVREVLDRVIMGVARV